MTLFYELPFSSNIAAGGATLLLSVVLTPILTLLVARIEGHSIASRLSNGKVLVFGNGKKFVPAIFIASGAILLLDLVTLLAEFGLEPGIRREPISEGENLVLGFRPKAKYKEINDSKLAFLACSRVDLADLGSSSLLTLYGAAITLGGNNDAQIVNFTCLDDVQAESMGGELSIRTESITEPLPVIDAPLVGRNMYFYEGATVRLQFFIFNQSLEIREGLIMLQERVGSYDTKLFLLKGRVATCSFERHPSPGDCISTDARQYNTIFQITGDKFSILPNPSDELLKKHVVRSPGFLPLHERDVFNGLEHGEIDSYLEVVSLFAHYGSMRTYNILGPPKQVTFVTPLAVAAFFLLCTSLIVILFLFFRITLRSDTDVRKDLNSVNGIVAVLASHIEGDRKCNFRQEGIRLMISESENLDQHLGPGHSPCKRDRSRALLGSHS